MQPTHKKAILDLLVVRNLNKVIQHGQFPAPGFSLHDLIYLSYSVKTMKFKPKIIEYRNFKELISEDLMADVRKVPWYLIEDEPSIETKVEKFNQFMLEIYDKHVPVVKRRVTHPPAPWLTPEIRQLMACRDQAFVTFKKGNEPSWWVYKKLRNKVNQLIRNAKIRYAHSISKDTGKQLWTNLKKIGITSKSEVKLPEININELNKYFASTVEKPPLDQVQQTTDKIESLPTHTGPAFKFSLTTQLEVKNAIMSIKSQAIGTDNISISFIKRIIEEIAGIITHIFNYSLFTSTFPKIWKQALVRPIPKSRQVISFADLRPINILPAISKAFEKIACTQITNYLIDNALLDPYQSGFKQYHSTTTALLHITDEISTAQDNGCLSLLVLLDFSKAFDSLNHQVFLSILKSLRFSNESIQWFRAYFQERRQRICMDGTLSEYHPTDTGVMQGTVCGPIFFSIYTRHLKSCLKFCKYHVYADDIQIYIDFKAADIEGVIENVNSDLQRIVQWAERMFLKINPIKTKSIILGSQMAVAKVINTVKNKITVGGVAIPFQQNAVNNLGILIDSNLEWSSYVSNITKKVHRSLHMLNRCRKFLPIKIKKQLVTSLIMPYFDYGDTIYNSCNIGSSGRLHKVMNEAVRFIYNSPKRNHITPLYRALNWLNLEQRRNYHLMIVVHKILYGWAPNYLKNKVSRLSSTRNGTILEIPAHNTATFGNTFRVRAAKNWNTLPQRIRNECNLKSFQKQLKEFLLADAPGTK